MPQWIVSKWFDSAFILLPHYIGILLLLLFPGWFVQFNEAIPAVAWVVLIMCIDVAHVYSTLFRTYFDKLALKQNQNVLLLIPFIGFTASIIVYQIGPLFFWRLLAYTAVFHFIRQQYGFLKLYQCNTTAPKWSERLDVFFVYSFTALPIIIWHFTGLKKFNWFVENDFLYIESSFLRIFFTNVFYLLFLFYAAKEFWIFFRHQAFSLPKTLLLLGTAASWFVGIVLLNGDLSFTFLNVVSHGIPYMALVWYYGNKNYVDKSQYPFLRKFFNAKGAVVMLLILVVFAYVEEGLWDGFIWHEHLHIFSFFTQLPSLAESPLAGIIIPALTLPQLTHYVLDGFIWKIGKNNFYWRKI